MDFTQDANTQPNTQQREEMNNTPNQQQIIIAVVAFIIGIGVGFIFSDGSVPEETTQNNATNTPATSTEQQTPPNELVAATTTSVSVSNQTAGNSVAIDEAQIDQTGWVAVYENVGGTPGSILGAQLIQEGTWSGDVQLLRNTSPNSKYFVKLLNDNGDNEFNHEEDLPLTNAEGDDIRTSFQTFPSSPRGGE